jgi:hypothetical protein
VPPSGYINVLDFKSPKDLADYLLYLDKNATAYNVYFKWKKHISFYDQSPTTSSFSFVVEPVLAPICSMCIQLYLERHFNVKMKKQIIEDAGRLWNKKLDCNNLEVNTLQLSAWSCWFFECDTEINGNEEVVVDGKR